MSLHGHLEYYRSLGELVDDFIMVAKTTRVLLADQIGVSTKTLGRWCGGSVPEVEHLRKFASEYLLPFELLLRLANGIPTFANLRSRRFAYSEWGLELVNQKILRKELFKRADSLSSIEIVEVRSNLRDVLNSSRRVYTKRRPSPDVFERAEILAPSFNLIARGPNSDHRGEKTYSGHLLVFPLRATAYKRLREKKLDGAGEYAPLLHEGDLKLDHLVEPKDPEFGGLHIQSLFAFNSQVAYALLRQLVWELVQRWELLTLRNAYLSQYVVTADSNELAEKLELERVFDDLPEKVRSDTEITPAYWEARISDLAWLEEYRGSRRE